MERQVHFKELLFDVDTFIAAKELFASVLPEGVASSPRTLMIGKGRERFYYDSEAEFVAAHREQHDQAYYGVSGGRGWDLSVNEDLDFTTVSVEASDSASIEAVLGVFRAAEGGAKQARLLWPNCVSNCLPSSPRLPLRSLTLFRMSPVF